MPALSYKLYRDGSPPKFVWLTGVVGGLALILAFRTLRNHTRGDGLERSSLDAVARFESVPILDTLVAEARKRLAHQAVASAPLNVGCHWIRDRGGFRPVLADLRNQPLADLRGSAGTALVIPIST